MLSDRHLSMKHRRIELILIIGANDKNWTVKERGEIFKRALDIYIEKRRKTKLEPPRKVVILYSIVVNFFFVYVMTDQSNSFPPRGYPLTSKIIWC